MLDIYLTENVSVHEKLKSVIERRLGSAVEIKRTESGKPFIEGNPLYFSLSHSAGSAMLALCDRPVGIDLEAVGRRHGFLHILSRFTERERGQINRREDFLSNWVSKEAYIKMTGGTLARDLKKLEYYGGALYCDGIRVNGSALGTAPGIIYSVCTNAPTDIQGYKII